MRYVRLFLLIVLTISFAAQARDRGSSRPFGQGLPLPWPFPWAKECPVDWKSLDGRYVLSESDDQEQIDLDISIIESLGFKIVHVARFTRTGLLIYEGFNFVGHNQRTIRLFLWPQRSYEPGTMAMIQLHYQGVDLHCTDENLIPILTLERVDSEQTSRTQYVLLRLTHGR